VTTPTRRSVRTAIDLIQTALLDMQGIVQKTSGTVEALTLGEAERLDDILLDAIREISYAQSTFPLIAVSLRQEANDLV